ncbi:MAG: hypothetical protein J7M26_02420 [Armatimonadetes bacterium]|nr:hypothetical protein [Armatimonadota bacterium]
MGSLRAALETQGVGGEEWPYLRQVLEAYAVTPIVEARALVKAAALNSEAQQLVALVNARSPQWWAGKHVAWPACRDVAEELGLSVRVKHEASAAGAAVSLMGAWAKERLRTAAFVTRGAELAERFVKAGQGQKVLVAGSIDVLMLTSGPVIERLARKIASVLGARGVRTLLARDPLAPTGPEADDLLSLGSFLGKADLQEAMEVVRQGPDLARATMAELSPHLTAGEREVLQARLLGLGLRERPLLALARTDARRLLEAVRPAVVMAFTFLPRLLTPYVVEARLQGARSVVCQHGLIAGLDYASEWFDEALVFNEYTAELVRQRTAESTRVQVVGNPGLEKLALERPEPAQVAPPGEGAVVLVATQPNDPPGSRASPEWWFRAVAEACAQLKAYLAAKLHPQQSAEVEGVMYEGAMQAAGARGRVIPHGEADLTALIAGCDVFVSQYSSSLLEAIVLGKPTVFVELRDGPPFYPFDDEGMAQRVTRREEVAPALAKALEEAAPSPTRQKEKEQRQRFFARHVEPFDGQAVERIAAAVEELLGG